MPVLPSELGISWQEAGLVVITTLVIYAVTVVTARLFGQREFAALGTHDLVLVFALGSIIGRVVLVRTSLAAAVLGLTTMFGVHAVMGHVHHRSSRVHALMQNQPILVVAEGRPVPEQLRRAHLSQLELHQLLREQGHASFEGLRAVVLEPNGRASAIASDTPLSSAFVEDVDGAELLRTTN